MAERTCYTIFRQQKVKNTDDENSPSQIENSPSQIEPEQFFIQFNSMMQFWSVLPYSAGGGGCRQCSQGAHTHISLVQFLGADTFSICDSRYVHMCLQ